MNQLEEIFELISKLSVEKQQDFAVWCVARLGRWESNEEASPRSPEFRKFYAIHHLHRCIRRRENREGKSVYLASVQENAEEVAVFSIYCFLYDAGTKASGDDDARWRIAREAADREERVQIARLNQIIAGDCGEDEMDDWLCDGLDGVVFDNTRKENAR